MHLTFSASLNLSCNSYKATKFHEIPLFLSVSWSSFDKHLPAFLNLKGHWFEFVSVTEKWSFLLHLTYEQNQICTLDTIQDFLCKFGIVWRWHVLKSIRFVNSVHKDLVSINWQLMSALASLDRFGEGDLVFINQRSCRHCLQNEWPLVNKW